MPDPIENRALTGASRGADNFDGLFFGGKKMKQDNFNDPTADINKCRAKLELIISAISGRLEFAGMGRDGMGWILCEVVETLVEVESVLIAEDQARRDRADYGSPR